MANRSGEQSSYGTRCGKNVLVAVMDKIDGREISGSVPKPSPASLLVVCRAGALFGITRVIPHGAVAGRSVPGIPCF